MVKLGRADIVVQITELGTYSVSLMAENTRGELTARNIRHWRFEIPVGSRPISEDLRTILLMVAEELQR